MDLLGTTLETSILPVLNSTIHLKKPFPSPIPALEGTNVLLSRFHNRPRDPPGSSWIISSIDDRRKRVLCAISPQVAQGFYDKYHTEITEETGLVIKFVAAPALSLVSGAFIDSLPPFLPVQYDPSKYRGISDARMIVVVTKAVHKVSQGASLQHRFVPMLSVVIDKQPESPTKTLYPPDRRARKRVEFQQGYMSQKYDFTDLQKLAEPSRGSLEDVITRDEALDRGFELTQPDKVFHHKAMMKEFLVDEKKMETERVEDEEMEYWTEVFETLEGEVGKRTPFIQRK